MSLVDFFSRHSRVMLQFSAGKDSAACLYLLEPFWDQLTVAWMNPGAPTKETVAYMERIRALVPNFLEVKGDQPAWIAEHGYPVDVLPFASTQLARIAFDGKGVKFSEALDCCSANMWQPMARAVISGNYSGVIRGQKQADFLKSPLRSGQVIDGIEYLFPIENWSDEDVLEFLGPNLPAPYTRGLRSSIDCRNCTAYAAEHRGLIDDLRFEEPEAAAEIFSVHQELQRQLQDYIEILKGC